MSKNSERKVIKLDRIHRIAISAMKQSKQPFLPTINSLTSYTEFIEQCNNSNKYIAHLVDEDRKSLKSIPLNSDYCILIGPEGDFTSEEVENAFEKGFKPVHLGKSRLRTETAGIAACHSINFLHES